jgi:hypothetical protein
MADRSEELLAMLQAGGGAAGVLRADEVNGLCGILAIAPTDIPELIAGLQKAGLLELRWGGEVRLTEEGKRRASGKSADAAPGSITIGDVQAGAAININSPNSVVGRDAMGAGAMRLEPAAAALADRALATLREVTPTLAQPKQQSAEALAQTVKQVVADAQAPGADKDALHKRVTQVKELVTDLSDIGEKGGKLWSALAGIAAVVGPIARGLGIPWPF